MYFKSIYGFMICSLLLLLTACGDADKEKELVDLFTTASQDLIAINFPAGTTEEVISINTYVDYKIEGLKSNGIDIIPIDKHITWSLSAGAISTIDQNGRLSTGNVAETVSVNAKFGVLTTSLSVFVSAAKFDKVVKLNSTPVLVNMCQAQQIQPVGSYLNDDSSEEIRPVDNTIISSITWLIRNQEDDTPSQRAFIKTENGLTKLQALETGNVIIQAKAMSLSSGNSITSADFNQTLDHNLNSLKLCLSSETDLAACAFSSTDIAKNAVVALMAIGNYQATNGSTFNQNISAYSKWGIDNTSNATIAFAADRERLNVTAITQGTTANITVACGNIEQTVLDSQVENGVVLDIPVTCDSVDIKCLQSTAAINIVATTLASLTVTANGIALVNDTALTLAIRPASIVLSLTANFSDGSSQNVTTDTSVVYNNRSTPLITAIANSPGQYNVPSSGNADIQIIYQNQTFIAKITIP